MGYLRFSRNDPLCLHGPLGINVGASISRCVFKVPQKNVY